MTDRRGPTILDCTLRDGSYPLDFQFTADDTYRIARGLDRAGVGYVEVGHGLGLYAQHALGRPAAESDREYIEAAAAAVEDARVGAFYIPGIGRLSDVEMAADAGADFVRVGANVTEFEEMREAIEVAADEGLTVCGNLMKSYAVDPDTVAARMADIESWGADVVYIVDSAGGMLPEDIHDYVEAAVESTSTAEVGLHSHDNLDMAVANSLAAMEAGATWIDTTLQGIGRSAGNASTEAFATVIQKRGLGEGIDQKALMDLGQREVAELAGDKRTDPLDLTAGYALFHTKFLTTAVEYADEYGVDARDLIVEVSKEDLVEPSEELIRTAAERLRDRGEPTSLGRRTNYLEHSRSYDGVETGPERRTPADLSRQVAIDARKYGKRGIVSLTAGFRAPAAPTPTVIHRSDQAVLGNVQVADREQARSALADVDDRVDTVAIDARIALSADEIDERNVLQFDGGLAIARALAALVDQQTPRPDPTHRPPVVVVGDHDLARLLGTLLDRGGYEATVHESVADLDATDPAAVVGFTRDRGAMDEATVERLPASTLFVDAGIRSFSQAAIERAKSAGNRILRSDTRAGYITEVEAAIITEELLSEVVGSTTIDGVRVVAGGAIGDRGDVVVDSLRDPSQVVGIADGRGGLVEDPTEEERRRRRTVEGRI